MSTKTGLVMEGGAMRGMFTAGVTDVMMENGVTFDGAIGVSAGAVFGCNYKSNQPGRVIRYNTRFCADPRFCSFRSLIRTGDMFGADFCYRELPTEHDLFDYDTYRSSPMEFYSVCTDLETGNAVYHLCESLDEEEMDWLRASASMPLASKPVMIDGKAYLDGGIADSIPLRAFESLGYGRSVVILTQPKGYVKTKNPAMPLMRAALRKYPKFIKTMEHRHTVYNESLAYVRGAESEGRAFVICPDEKLPVGHIEHDPDVLRKVYEIGRVVGERNLAGVKTFLGAE